MAQMRRLAPQRASRNRAVGARRLLLVAVCSAWLWGLGVLALAGDYPLEVIELRSRLPEELIPTLLPLAGPDGTVVGAHHSLFVRASPQRLADVRRAVAELDRPARGLLIQVRQGASLGASRTGVAVRIDESAGGRDSEARLRLGPRGPGGSRVVASAGQGDQRLDLTQEVRTLDGHAAFIAVGTDRPLPLLGLEPDGRLVRRGAVYQSAQSGFYVVPRILGERVILGIETQAASAAGAGALHRGAVNSRVEGRLGDWIPIGTSTESAQTRGYGLSYGTRIQAGTETWVELRVIPVD
jgi:hypothetical protein